MDLEQQLRGRHARLPGALLCRQSGHGCHCRAIRARADALGYRDSIIVPGAFTKGTNHFAHSGKPGDGDVVAEYEAGPYAGFAEQVQKAFGAIVPEDADAGAVADAITQVVGAPFGQRPFRVHIDPTQDGADVGFAVLDRLRAEMLRRVGLGDLLKVRRD